MKEYSSRRYNTIFVLIIFVIATVFGVYFFFSSSEKSVISADPSQPDDIVLEEPVINDENNNSTQTAPVFQDGMQAAMYSIKMLDNLDFCCTQTTNTLEEYGLGNVNIYMQRYRHQNHDVLLTWSTNSTKLSIGKYFQSKYSNAETTLKRQTSNYNFSKKTYTFTNEKISGDITKFEDFEYTDNHAHTNDFFIQFDTKNARASYFKKDKSTYETKIILNPSMLNDSEYAQKYKRNCDEVHMHKINLTFTIDRKTGYVLKIASEEEYTLVAYGISAKCQTKMVQVYNYNVETKSKILQIAQNDFGLYPDLKV